MLVAVPTLLTPSAPIFPMMTFFLWTLAKMSNSGVTFLYMTAGYFPMFPITGVPKLTFTAESFSNRTSSVKFCVFSTSAYPMPFGSELLKNPIFLSFKKI